MTTLFDDFICENDLDGSLVAAAIEGDVSALNLLFEKHQRWIFCLALSYTHHVEDAEDSVQEILMKATKRISKFKRRGLFKSWLRRFAKNHLINTTGAHGKQVPLLFSAMIEGGEGSIDPIDHRNASMDMPLLIEEARTRVLLGLLLCLDQRQRVAVVVSDFLELKDHVGAVMLGVTDSTYRVMLAQARKELQSFLKDECGLLTPGKQCRCARKSAAYARLGYVDPHTRTFRKQHVDQLRRFVGADNQSLETLLQTACATCIGHQRVPETISLAQLLSAGKKRE